MTRAIAAAVIACATAAPALAQDFLAVPYVVTANPAVFTGLFSRARVGPGIHALLIGDSQEACPASFGSDYVPAFNAAWTRRYGVAPRTPLVQPGLSFNAPDGEWLVCARNFTPFVAPPPPAVAPDALPGLANWTLPAPTGDQRGWALLLQPRANGVDNALPIDHTRDWIDCSQGVYLDVLALRSAGDVAVTFTTVDGDAPVTGGTTVLNATTALALAPDTGPLARCRIGPVPCPTLRGVSLQVEFVGATPDSPAHLVSASFGSVAADVGLTATDIAAGGYTTRSFAAVHPDALPQLRGLGADMAFISLGANDVASPPEQFKQNMAELIATLRQHTSPDLPIVILSDPAHGLASEQQNENAQFFPRAVAELAAELPAVCAVNSRRLTHEQGWTVENVDSFTVDHVHYTPQGATLKADLEISVLWGAFVCAADVGQTGGLPGADGQLDNNDFVAFVSAYFANQPVADCGGQGGHAGGDGKLDNNDFVVFITAFFTGCP